MKINPLAIGCLCTFVAMAALSPAKSLPSLSANEITSIPGFGDSVVGTLLREDVANELRLDNYQRHQIQDAVFGSYVDYAHPGEPVRESGHGRRRGGYERRDAGLPASAYMARLDDAAHAATRVLNSYQTQRFDEIYLQAQGSLMLATDPKMADEIHLDSVQVRRIADIYDGLVGVNNDAVRGTWDWHRNGLSDILSRNRSKARDMADRVLTDEQFHHLDSLKGRPIAFRMDAEYFLGSRY